MSAPCGVGERGCGRPRGSDHGALRNPAQQRPPAARARRLAEIPPLPALRSRRRLAPLPLCRGSLHAPQRPDHAGRCACPLLPFVGCKSKSTAKYRIAVIPKGLTHEFWQSIERGSQRRRRRPRPPQGVSVEVLWDGPLKESDAQEQIRPRPAQRRQHAASTASSWPRRTASSMVPVVEEAVEKGVPVVIIDSGLDEPQDLIVKYVATDNYNGGRLAAEAPARRRSAKQGKTAPKLVLFRYAARLREHRAAREGLPRPRRTPRSSSRRTPASRPSRSSPTGRLRRRHGGLGPERRPAPLLSRRARTRPTASSPSTSRRRTACSTRCAARG